MACCRYLSVIVLALLACNRSATNRDGIAKPTDEVASAKPSASIEVPVAIMVTQARCAEGRYIAPVDPQAASADAGDGGDTDENADAAFGIGGLGLSGTGGFGTPFGAGDEGIGLGTGSGPAFGFGSIATISLVKLEGQTLRVDGLPREDVERRVCSAYPGFMRCVDDRATSENDLEATIGLSLVVATHGTTSSTLIGSTLEGDTFATCMTTVANELVFDEPVGTAGKGAVVRYAFHARRPRKKPAAKIKATSGDTVVGKLPIEVIRRIVRSRIGQVRACYAKALTTDPSIAGSMTVQAIIASTGDVDSATVIKSDMSNPGLKACVTKVFASMSFPEPDGGGKVTFTYPIKFENIE